MRYLLYYLIFCPALLVCFSVGPAFCTEFEANWPAVKDQMDEYVFLKATDAHVVIDIYAVDGRKLYDFQCHPGDYPDDPMFDYSGFFHCRLISLYSEEELGSLLTDSFEETKEWENRGRFLVEHLSPEHECYDDWGRERSFSLRGMDIVLKVYDESLEENSDKTIGINSFKFSISIKNNPSSVRAISTPPKKPRPKWFYRP